MNIKYRFIKNNDSESGISGYFLNDKLIVFSDQEILENLTGNRALFLNNDKIVKYDNKLLSILSSIEKLKSVLNLSENSVNNSTIQFDDENTQSIRFKIDLTDADGTQDSIIVDPETQPPVPQFNDEEKYYFFNRENTAYKIFYALDNDDFKEYLDEEKISINDNCEKILSYIKYNENGTDVYSSLNVLKTNKKLISFSIHNTAYQAEEGMTWEQWVESSYNTTDWIAWSWHSTDNTAYIATGTSDPQSIKNSAGNYIIKSDNIDDSGVYTLVVSPHAP